MAKYRNPVENGKLPRPLACIDIDPVTGKRIGERCRSKWLGYTGSSFDCPNKGPHGCSGIAFLYPRKRRKNGDFHFHQGVDDMAQEGTPIYAVTDGRVLVAIDEFNGTYNCYGKTVVVETKELPSPLKGPLYFLYAHCASIQVRVGDYVRANQQIATVGRTFYNSENPTAQFRDGAHLHFEALTSLKSLGKETQLGEDGTRSGNWNQPRLDPMYILECLGPWDMTEVYFPSQRVMKRAVADVLHEMVETSGEGGYFPLGANNIWHGGVNISGPTRVVAPFDASIVAFRLDPEPEHAIHAGGSSNFILLRHEIEEAPWRLFQGEPPRVVSPKTTDVKSRAVGTKSRCANEPPDVLAVKAALHSHKNKDGRPFYNPDEATDLENPAVGKTLRRAIEAFQEEVVKINPDGVVDIPGKTWTALYDGAPPEEPVAPPPPEEPVDPGRVIYSLLMHLAPLPLNARTAEAYPWLRQVHLDPKPGDQDEEDQAKQAQATKEDEDESQYRVTGSVGAANKDGEPAENAPDDVRWVSKRLIRFGYYDGPPTDTCDDALIEAIRSLQNDHHKSFKKKKDGDGRVDTDGGTIALLHKTEEKLRGKSAAVLDPILVHRCTQRDEHGVGKVISGLDITVRSGEPLWESGTSAKYDKAGQITLAEQYHWEIFSEALVVEGWEPPLEDLSPDLIADVPAQLLERIESVSSLHADYLLTPAEVAEFYAKGTGSFFRRTPCRFMSHWSLDPVAAATRLGDMGYEESLITETLRPFMWWKDARDVLPSSSIVYHYNPVEFLAVYSEILETLRPETRDPATHPTLIVRVLYEDGTPMPNAEIELLQGVDVLRTATTRDTGEAEIVGVAVGEYGVRTAHPTLPPRLIEMIGGQTTEVTIQTDVPAPPPPRGKINVVVRKHSYSIADKVDVWLTPEGNGDIRLGTTTKGKLCFEDIVYGDYEINAGQGEAVAVTLDKKSKTVTARLPPPIGTLVLTVQVEGEPAQFAEVEIRNDDGFKTKRFTDNEGLVSVEIPEGRYKVVVGDVVKKVSVKGDDSTRYTIKLEEIEPPEEGCLVVTVTDDEGKPALFACVLVTAPEVVEGNFSDMNGVAEFKLDPGDYYISIDDIPCGGVTIYPGKTMHVPVELEEPAIA